MAEADPNRPTWWMVTYELDPVFFKLGTDEQFKLKTGDYEYGFATALERKWKAAYTTTDLEKGWLLFKLGNRDQAEKMLQGYVMYKYFTNVKYTPVYSASQGGLNLKIIVGGLKRFFRDRF
jgi:hypothetical protein